MNPTFLIPPTLSLVDDRPWGPAFLFFGAYSFAVIGYSLTCLYWRLRTETNPVLHLKFKYALISFGFSGALTLCNIPATNGIDVYPLGNLSFIPLLVMAYGILKYRMLDIRRMMRSWPDGWLFAVLAGWFGLNLLYFTKAQPAINHAFNQSHANRFQNRTAFLEEIAFLKNLEELSAALTRALSNGLGLSHADLYISPSVAQRILEAVRAIAPKAIWPAAWKELPSASAWPPVRRTTTRPNACSTKPKHPVKTASL
jgi:hypothetical protein